MQKNEWPRNVVIGLVVAAIVFGWWLRGFLYINWHFRLFSRQSWSFIMNEFKSGWMLNTTSDWIFLLTLLFAIPFFLYMWYLCTKVRWRQLIKKTWKWIVGLCVALFAGHTYVKHKNSKKKKTTLAPPPPAPILTKQTTSARPMAMTYQGTAVNNTSSAVPERGPTFDAGIPSAPTHSANLSNASFDNASFDNMDDLSNMPLENIQLPTREPVVEDIPALFNAAGYSLIPDIKTSVQSIDYVAVSASHILVCLIDKEAGDWLAEEEPFNGEAPLWFSEVDHRVSPIYELQTSVKEIQDQIAPLYPDMTVQGIMIEQKGNIINAEEMLRVWQELNVIVARTDVGGTEDIPVTQTVLKHTDPASAATVEAITKVITGDING